MFDITSQTNKSRCMISFIFGFLIINEFEKTFHDHWVQFFKSDLVYLGDEFFRTTLKSSTLKKTVKLTIVCPRYTKMFDLAFPKKE